MKFKINPSVFNQHPELIVYIPVITQFNNQPTEDVKQKILSFIRNEEEQLKQKYSSLEELVQDSKIKPYLQTFEKWQANINKILPTHLALAKRIIEGGNLPNVNPIVNLYNAVSIKYLTPFGGEDLSKIYGDFELVQAKGDEHWLGINAIKPKSPVKNELIWQDDYDVSTRHLNWRQCERTKLTEASKDGWFIMDGFSNTNKDIIKIAADEFIARAIEYFGGETELLYIDKNNPEANLDYQTRDITGITKPYIEIPFTKRGGQEKHGKVIQKAETTYSYTGIANQIQEIIFKVLKELNTNIKKDSIFLEHPNLEQHGDYTTNIAMQLFPKIKQKSLSPLIPRENGSDEGARLEGLKSPRELAQAIIDQIQNTQHSMFDTVTIAGPGFINFKLSNTFLLDELQIIKEKKEEYGSSNWGMGEKWLLEHTSPNPNKSMHLGHLRNNIIGMALGNLWETIGINVIRDCIDNNRGIAIARLMWGYLKFAKKDGKEVTDIQYWYDHRNEWQTPEEVNQRPDRFMDKLYVKASEDFKNPDIEDKVRQLVVDWEAHDKTTWALWEKVLNYSHTGQRLTLERLGNKWDKVWHEHEHYQEGKNLVEEGIKKGIFRKLKDGAILTNLKKDFNLTDTIVQKKDGTALYITQDLALTRKKKEEFNPNKMHWVIGPEQELAMKQAFAVCDQLGIIEYKNCHHIAYGYMSIKGLGKMSSREGNVVYIDDLIDQTINRIMIFIFEGIKGNLGKALIDQSIDKICKKEIEEITKEIEELKDILESEKNIGLRKITRDNIRDLNQSLKQLEQRSKNKLEFIDLIDDVEQIALGAVKYSILKNGRLTNTAFDIKTSIDIHGNSGPYLQYTHARCQSVLLKSNQKLSLQKGEAEQSPTEGFSHNNTQYSINPEELSLLRQLYKFPEIVQNAALEYAPNHLCTYLFELAQRYNTFYNKHSILSVSPFSKETDKKKEQPNSSNNEIITKQFRLGLTQATAQVIKNGLNLLGIKAPEKM